MYFLDYLTGTNEKEQRSETKTANSLTLPHFLVFFH